MDALRANPEVLYAAVTGQDPSRCGNAFPGMLLNDVFPCHGDDQWIRLAALSSAGEEAAAGEEARQTQAQRGPERP